EAAERICGIWAGDDKIEVTYSFPTAAQASGDCDFLNAGRVWEIDRQLFGYTLGVRQQVAAGALTQLLDRGEDFFLQLRSHSRQFPELVFFAETFQVVQVSDLKVLEQQCDGLRSEALYLQQLECTGRVLLQQFVTL